ncbi:MAG TPA: hypothetical protein VMU95_08770 [Trebonia sp.]|nr:hypothetical protein [Trebonia sp.]
MHYHRLMALVLLVNGALLGWHLAGGEWHFANQSTLSGLANLIVVNFAIAVLIRQQHVLNVIFTLAGRGSSRWPLWLRRTISKAYHIGGLHVGAALAGTAWLGAFTVVAAVARTSRPVAVDPATFALAMTLTGLLVVVVLGALPPVRARFHDLFELTHRFGGWASVGLFWALTVHLQRADLSSWQIWLLGVITASIAWPWLRLRRVPITVERPSAHAAIVHLDYGVTPTHVTGVGISRSPLREWHTFATVSTPGQSGYRLLVSRAGDWTSRLIDDPPKHLWVRGVPTRAPIPAIEVMYCRVVYVVTGSGIGPMLGLILNSQVPSRLVWSTRSPRATYGDALVDEVLAAQPDALIWDTTERGKPDLLPMAHGVCLDFAAEAVLVVSNKITTRRLVHGLEQLGVPTFGPIWDS